MSDDTDCSDGAPDNWSKPGPQVQGPWSMEHGPGPWTLEGGPGRHLAKLHCRGQRIRSNPKEKKIGANPGLSRNCHEFEFGLGS